MKIYTDKRTGVKYADYMVGKKRMRVSLHTKNEKIALIKAAQLADNKDTLKSGKIPLEAFLVRFRAFQKATRKPTTIRFFETALREFLEQNKVKYLQEITPALLDNFAISLKTSGQNAAGINRKVRALTAAMRRAEFWELISPQNWVKVSKFKESKGRVEYHTPQEIKQILKAVNAEWQLVVLLGCRAGLRRGEMAFLKWQDVDFAHNQIYIAPHKTEKYRYIPLSQDLRKALEKAFKARQKGFEYVVVVGENRNSKNYLTKEYSNKMKKKQIPFRCFLHKLRHTFASHLVINGADLYYVCKLMGHSSIKQTEKYAHLAPTDLKSAIKKLPKI